jgi:ubiquinone/menaquinone biosynthesis C-methylase UbiE
VTPDLPASYRRWRQSRLGQITDRLEDERIFELAGGVKGRRALDVGSGDGRLAAALRRAGAEVTALDADPRMLAAARTRADTERISLALVRGDAARLPFRDATFDLVTAVTLLCFVPDARAVVAEMARVLEPGGRLVLGELARWNVWAAQRRFRGWLGSPTWRRAQFRSERELRELLEAAGLRVVATRGAIFYPPIGWCAFLLSSLDRWLGRHARVGAAFLAICALKPR